MRGLTFKYTGFQKLNDMYDLNRQTATPADASKVSWTTEEDRDDLLD
jgi:hypothetical protein